MAVLLLGLLAKIRGLSDLLLFLKASSLKMASVESDPEITEFTCPEESGGVDGADGCADGEQSASWADEEHVDDSSMPDTLMHLIKNGVRLSLLCPGVRLHDLIW